MRSRHLRDSWPRHRPGPIWVAAWLVATLAPAATAAPTINQLSLRGLQSGGETVVELRGQDLLPAPRLILPVPIEQQEVLEGATSQRVQIRVTLPPIPAGIYQLRLGSGSGVSNPVPVGIDDLPQRPWSATTESLPVALHVQVTGAQVMRTSFAGEAGQRVVIDVESRRLGAALRPVVRLLDDRGVQLAWSGGRAVLGGDARCELHLPADGTYHVELHDELYKGPQPAYARVKIGDLHYADLAFPLAVSAGDEAAAELLMTSLPPDSRSVVVSNPDTGPGPQPIDFPLLPHVTGGQPWVMLSELDERLEGDDAGSEEAAAPMAWNGRLSEPGEEDTFWVRVQPGSRLRIDVRAARAGSPLDGILIVRHPSGSELARNDDRPMTSDPGLDNFQVPADVDRLQLVVRDLLGRGGETFVYRLEVRPRALRDFELVLENDRINVPAGATQTIRVQVQRRGYNGPIDLEIQGADNMQVTGDRIPAGAVNGLVSLTAAEGDPESGTVSVIGRSADGRVTRVARLASTVGSATQPWFRGQIGLARSRPVPLSIAWGEEAGEAVMYRGMPLTLPMRMSQEEGWSGRLRLKLLTSQTMPTRQVQRGNQNVTEDDTSRALRLLSEVMVEAGQPDPHVDIAVPADLPDGTWAIAVLAEWLPPEGDNVLASISSPVRSFAPRTPLSLSLTSTGPFQGVAGAGESSQLVGTVERIAGFPYPVTVTLEGLPEGLAAPSQTVSPEDDAFSLDLKFAYGSEPRTLENLKLVATAQPDSERPDLLVRSNTIDLKMELVAGLPPDPEPVHVVFEDDPEFAGYLSQGGGAIEVDTGDVYRGEAALRVTPDQRFHESVPNLGIAIRQNPGPGEYRYLRFAWKKVGGRSICLQLNHDGTWGPGGTGNAGAKFRYHAGPGGECFGASLAVSNEIPRNYVVVTRDLYADFGEFTLTGIALSPIDGRYGLFDHMVLARSLEDFERADSEGESDTDGDAP